MGIRTLCIAAFLILSTSVLRADEVQIGRTDRLSGAILGMKAGTLRIGTEHLGEMGVPWNAVTDVRSDTDLAVYAEGGKVIVGVLAGMEGGALKVKTAQAMRNVDVTQIYLISAELPRSEKPSPVVLWKGSLQFGFGWVTGNKERNEYLIGGDIRRIGPNTELFISALGEQGKTEQTTDLARARGALTLNLNQAGRTYISANTTTEHDDVKQLNLRENYALSIGYRAAQAPPNLWYLELGGNYVHENYRSRESDDFTIRLHSLAERRIFQASRLKTSLVVNPSVKALHHVRSVNDLSLAFPLTGAMNLQVTVTHEWDSEPPAGVKPNDLRTRTMLVYGF